MKDPIYLYGRSTCSKCLRARALLQEIGAAFIERDFAATPATVDEIRELAGTGSVVELLNPARQAYRELGFEQRTPGEEEALSAILQEPNLLYRPIVIRGSRRVLGLHEDAIRALVAGER